MIDFDCHPTAEAVAPADNRLAVYRELAPLRERAHAAGESRLTERLDADLAYLRALMGERLPLDEYVRLTQGCHTAGWPADYVTAVGAQARVDIEGQSVAWGPDTSKDLDQAEGPIDAEAAPEEIRRAAEDLEPLVRAVTGATAPYELTIESTHVDAYWGYWLDGKGPRVRLRLNLRNARFTKVRARQFALHEVLGHGLQCASFSERAAGEDVPWVRLLSVHTTAQVLLEGLAQALPLFITPDDAALAARVRLDHYTQLVRAELHLAINSGVSVADCAAHAQSRVPFWTDAHIADTLADRGTNPLLRSYLWAYPAGIDWFVALSEADVPVRERVLRAAYRDPLTPTDLVNLWPEGPVVGGLGAA